MKDKDAESTDDKKETGKNPLTKPDPETLHSSDPQEEMKGPVSSIVQAGKDRAEENDD